MICAKCEWIVSPLDDKARRADHFGRSIERASARGQNDAIRPASVRLSVTLVTWRSFKACQRMLLTAAGHFHKFRAWV
jgi:hypothetical protein